MTDVLFSAMTDGLVQGSHVNLPEGDFCCGRGILVIGSNILLTSGTIVVLYGMLRGRECDSLHIHRQADIQTQTPKR